MMEMIESSNAESFETKTAFKKLEGMKKPKSETTQNAFTCLNLKREALVKGDDEL